MNIHSRLRSALLPGLVVASSVALLGETVNLVYQPPEGEAFDIVERFTRVTMSGEAEPVTDVRQREYRIQVLRTETGFSNTATVQGLTLTRNEHQVASPVFASMQDLQLIYELGADGSLVGISGYENLPEAMSGKLPATLANTMIRFLNYDSLRHQDEAAYREVYRGLPGATLETGVLRTAARNQPLPLGGSMPLYIVEGLAQSEAEGPLVVTRRFHSDAATLAAEFEGIEEAALVAAAGEMMPMIPEGHEGATLMGSEQTVLDLAGLLVAERTENLEYTFAVKNPDPEGMAVQHSISEMREFKASPVVVVVVDEDPQ